MKSRFQLDQGASVRTSGQLIDPESADFESIDPEPIDPEYTEPECVEAESYDASEQYFASSLEKSHEENPHEPPRFVVEEQISCVDPWDDIPLQHPGNYSGVATSGSFDITARNCQVVPKQTVPKEISQEREPLESHEGISWRQEVAERLNKYQARRRPRGPRYPSLQLKFETQEATWRNPPAEVSLSPASYPNSAAVAVKRIVPEAASTEIAPQPPSSQAPVLETTARVIAFPRSSTAPPNRTEELADPVFDRPRIMEAPELEPAPPVPGGILIERTETPPNAKRPGFEMPLQSARMARRLAATAIDALIVLIGLSLFSCIVWRVTAMIPSTRLAAGMVAVVGGMLWAAYQFLLIVYCGTSPGLKLAKLRLSCFDGSSVSRKMRRWRVLASVLSGLSLGLGYAWCFLDEDQLCWHDRITRTYMAPRTQVQAGSGSV
jgi:hypothetical protein